jgi:hypothetical protein|tara:strand:- start:186 stop:593 length:408 start_codon:yes stop_codon:yes gene_type:complete
MVSRNVLELKTKEFFDKFWCLNHNPPVWSNPWSFKGELLNNQSKGCYAHLLGNEVTYVGLGIGKSFGGSGLGSRISNYWKYTGTVDGIREYEPIVKEVDSIITLPFGNDDFYLAAALEVYLIQNLDLKKNKVHSK